jgi:hypothetical protein
VVLSRKVRIREFAKKRGEVFGKEVMPLKR